MDNELTKDNLNDFFRHLKELEKQYWIWTGTLPKKLIINPKILRDVSRVTGFYQRPELRGEVTVYSPIVRYIQLKMCVVIIQEDDDEGFLHLEALES